MEEIRESFEEWFSGKFGQKPTISPFNPEFYLYQREQDMWEGWQSAHKKFSPKWISFEERMPALGEFVFIYDGEICHVGELNYDDGCYFYLDYDHDEVYCPYDEYTHWMPIPELENK